MKCIRAGDVYFLDSPFYFDKNDTESVIQCKRLSYLMGTCSSRPAVVIREPLFFDRYNTVTVLPALSRGDPAVIFKLTDRYGNDGETEYRFIPHNPHTIPISRLGRHIGSLEPDELKELMDAFEWIHNPEKISSFIKRRDIDDVPELYKEAFSRPHSQSWKYNKDARSDVVINVGYDGRLHSDTNPEVNGLLVSGKQITGQATNAIMADQSYKDTTSPLPDSVRDDEPMVPVEREYPESMFSKEVLNRVASRFGISEAYYRNGVEKRNILSLMDHEYPSMVSGLDQDDIAKIGEIYEQMTPVDAMLFWPRLQSDVLAYYADVPKRVVIAIKKICNTLRDMPAEEYEKRMKSYSNSDEDTAQTVPEDTRSVEVEAAEPEQAKPDYRKMLEAVRPYLSQPKVKIMPDEVARVFLELPMARVKHAWSGPNFKESYNSARNFYRTKFRTNTEV